MYTFGQPRVGNPTFAAAFAAVVDEYRVVHWRDLVPHLPLELMGYAHPPTEVCVPEGKPLICQTGTVNVAALRSRFAAAPRRWCCLCCLTGVLPGGQR